MKQNIAIYCRCGKDVSVIESQKLKAKILLKNNGCVDNEYEVKYYIDEGFSGTDNNRPSLNALIKDIKSKKINIVVTPKIETLSRDIFY